MPICSNVNGALVVTAPISFLARFGITEAEQRLRRVSQASSEAWHHKNLL